VLSEPDSEDENPLATSRRDKGKGRAPSPHEHSEAEIVRDFDPGDEEFGGEAVRDVEDEYDKALDDFGDFDFDFDLDLDKLNSNIATRHTSPLPNPRAPLAPIPPNHQSSFTDTLDQLSGLPMLHQLSDREQEFYKNHWRRGADRAEERREEYNVPARVQAAPKTNAVAKRGGFKARGSGRGRVRGRKR